VPGIDRFRSPSAIPWSFEIAFGVNVLAHFALRERLRAAGLLQSARVVILTGDIYVLAATECTPRQRWAGPLGGMRAYCRSKLGNLWIGFELARRMPELTVAVVHPGVVATHLGGDFGGVGAWLRRRIMIPPALGAETPLYCATQPVESGSYWHNVHGRMRLAPDDPASDAEAARRLFDRCAALAGC
jgi:NAD(P)-dependent dehydrogenase (short-subunit alcohol dehydrogenase family)